MYIYIYITQNKWQRQLAILIMFWQSLKWFGGNHPELVASSKVANEKPCGLSRVCPRVEWSVLGFRETPWNPVFGHQHQLRSLHELTHSWNLCTTELSACSLFHASHVTFREQNFVFPLPFGGSTRTMGMRKEPVKLRIHCTQVNTFY